MKKAVSELVLFDVNVLVALVWPQHQFHTSANRRLADANAWATCALTELSFLRLSATPAILRESASLDNAFAGLKRLLSDRRHQFLDRLPPALGLLGELSLQGPGQLTDAYLLGVARAHGATLVTFDRRMRAHAGPSEIEILS